MPYSRLVATTRRRRRIRKSIRAIIRDTSALLREFRVALLAFAALAIGGGYIYGELYRIARSVNIPLIDRPYIMLQLMILETPEAAPAEWYLVIFWYAMPILFVIIAGWGVADFVRLFFNRDERRDAWREAVASTYRNHIIVLGAGHVGIRVIAELVNMNLDVLVVDSLPDEGVDEALSAMGVPLILGDGRLPATLEKAGLRHARAFVACTGNDHVNLEVIMRVRDMNPNVRIVARMWDDNFAHQITNFMNVQSVLSSSGMAAPAFAGAALGIEITQTLAVGSVDYSMLRLTVNLGSFMDGKDVGSLQEDNEMDIVLHGDGGKVVVQPDRNTVVRAGDTLIIFARHDRITDVVARNHTD